MVFPVERLVRTNLAMDPQIKTVGNSNNTVQWGSPTRDTTTFPPGTANALRVTRTSDSGSPTIVASCYLGNPGSTDPKRILVTPGDVLSASVKLRHTHASSCNGQVLWVFRNAAGTQVGSTLNGPMIAAAPNTWTTVTFENVTVPATAAYCYIYSNIFATGTVPAGVQSWYGAVLIEKSPTAGIYFDGSTPDSGTNSYSWSGTPDVSPSNSYALDGNQVPVLAKYVQLSGTPAVGTVKFLSSEVLGVGGYVIYPTPVIKELDNDGAIFVDLFATDDPGINAPAWHYIVTENLYDQPERTYNIQVPMSAAISGINLSELEF